jgi:hypothetical protein
LDLAIDASAAVLLGVFVALLVMDYFDPRMPDTSVGAFPLLGSLVMLSWANLRADRASRPIPSAPET